MPEIVKDANPNDPIEVATELAKQLIVKACESDALTDGQVGSALAGAFVAYCRACGINDERIGALLGVTMTNIPALGDHAEEIAAFEEWTGVVPPSHRRLKVN